MKKGAPKSKVVKSPNPSPPLEPPFNQLTRANGPQPMGPGSMEQWANGIPPLINLSQWVHGAMRQWILVEACGKSVGLTRRRPERSADYIIL